MTRSERLLLIAFFGVVLSLLGGAEPTATALGAAAGAGAGVVAAGRLGRLRARMDARLGPDEPPPTGFALRRPAVRVAVHLVLLGALFVTTVLVPFVGQELFAASAAAATAFPLVLTAARVRG